MKPKTTLLHYSVKGHMKQHVIHGYKFEFFHNKGTEVPDALLDGGTLGKLEELNIIRFIPQGSWLIRKTGSEPAYIQSAADANNVVIEMHKSESPVVFIPDSQVKSSIQLMFIMNKMDDSSVILNRTVPQFRGTYSRRLYDNSLETRRLPITAVFSSPQSTGRCESRMPEDLRN